jgi:transcriptional regulator with XRE-family HTH domain
MTLCMDIKRQIGAPIRTLRKKRPGLTQEGLGQMIGLTNQAVGNLEFGESIPQATTVIGLVKVFEISADELLGINQKKQSTKRLALITAINDNLRKMSDEDLTRTAAIVATLAGKQKPEK